MNYKDVSVHSYQHEGERGEENAGGLEGEINNTKSNVEHYLEGQRNTNIFPMNLKNAYTKKAQYLTESNRFL